MPESLWTVASQVIVLFVLIALGVFCTRAHLFKEQFISGLTSFVLTFVTPCNIITSFQRDFDSGLLGGLLISFGAAFVFNLICLGLSVLTIRSKDPAKRRVLRFATMFSNCGYMALPLEEAVLGSIGVFFGATYVAVSHMFIWTSGIYMLSGDRKQVSARKLVTCPPLIAVAVGLVFFFTSTELPTVIAKPISLIGSMNTTLPMLIIGYYLARADLGRMFKTASLYVSLAVRLVVSPLLVVLGMRFVVSPLLASLGTELGSLAGPIMVAGTIAFAAPTAVITTMLAGRYGQDTELSAGAVSLSTILSIVTMPLIITLSQYLAG
ncbi:MAG: AEC family transporter [Lachnospiraceae bacterium]|nr:AEC family transporter [Lachnospiraceae bacterium]